jgi:hypothetical protein
VELVGAARPRRCWPAGVGADGGGDRRRLLDVKTGKYVDKPQVVITDGRIVSVGKAGDAVPAGAERVDLPGVTLLPGLIDMHVHLTSAGKYGGYTGYRVHRQLLDGGGRGQRQDHAGGRLHDGAQRGLGLLSPTSASARRSTRAGSGPADHGAAMRSAPPAATATRPSSADDGGEEPGSDRQPRRGPPHGAPDAQVRRPRDQDLRHRGVFSRGDAPGAQQLTLEEMKAIVEEAHMADMKVAAHAHGAPGIKAAILAGVDTIEHASLIDDEGIKLAVAKGAWLGFDIYNTDYTQGRGAQERGVCRRTSRRTATSVRSSGRTTARP